MIMNRNLQNFWHDWQQKWSQKSLCCFEPCWITRMVWYTQYILQWQEEPKYCQVQTDIFYLVLMRNISQEMKPQPHSQNGRRHVDPWCEESSALWGCRSFHQSLQLGRQEPDSGETLTRASQILDAERHRGGELNERSFRNQFELRPVLLKMKMEWYSKS